MNNSTMTNDGAMTTNNDQQWCYDDEQSMGNGNGSSNGSEEGNSTVNGKNIN